MRIRIGALEIIDPSPEELDDLIARYGGGGDVGDGDAPKPRNPGGGNTQGSTADMVVLKTLVAAGTEGLPTNDVGTMLGRRGKAFRQAVRDWALRVHLVSDPDLDPFDECRVGTQRGIRIKPSLMEIAKALVSK